MEPRLPGYADHGRENEVSVVGRTLLSDAFDVAVGVVLTVQLLSASLPDRIQNHKPAASDRIVRRTESKLALSATIFSWLKQNHSA